MYCFAFNGMEKDDEMHGTVGSSYTFGARMHDARVGRWLSLDPMATKFAYASPYNFGMGNPIYFVDPDGQVIKPFGNALKLVDFRNYIKNQVGLTSVGDYLQGALEARSIGTGDNTGNVYEGFGLKRDASAADFNRTVRKAVRDGEISAQQGRAARAIFGALADPEVIEVGVWTDGMHTNTTESEQTHVTNNSDIQQAVGKYVEGVNASDPTRIAEGINDATNGSVKYSPNEAVWEGEDRIETIRDNEGNEVGVKGHVGVTPGHTNTETNNRITEGLIEATDTP